MKRHTKYPELDRWFNEGLFTRRQFGGEQFGVGLQLWYVNRLRERYLLNSGVGGLWKMDRTSAGAPVSALERTGWIHAKIIHGFNNIPNNEIREIMRAMVLCESKPLPSAREIARVYGFAWEQFKYDFAQGLYEMHKAKVGIHV